MRIVLAVALAATVGGCATVTRGTTAQVQIISNPPGATARTSMGYQCLTPCAVQLNRKDEFTVIFTKPGYHSAEVPVRTQVAGAGAAGFVGNVVAGGVVGMGVDVATGAALEHFPNPVVAMLTPLRRGEPPKVIKIEPKPPEPKPNEAYAPETN
jgi:hypothetical protein